MTKIFISYSRKDTVFARRFTEALEKSQLETWIDWEDIPPTADWLDQIHKGIQQADGFLFLLSPDSVASKVCGQEVDHAVQNGKRLIPIVVRDVNPNNVHPALAKVNWIYAREGDDFDGAVAKTLSAIRTDLTWVESHRRLQVRALEWDKRKDRSLLLRGKDLREAEEQLASAGQKDPQPTDLQRRFILESRRGESRTRNLLLAISAGVMVVLCIASAIAVNRSNYATDQAQTAVAANSTAVMEANIRATAQANAEEQARIALSNGLSSSALLLQEKDEISLALLLSVQANSFAETARSRNALYTLLKQDQYMLSTLPMPVVTETFPSFQTNATGDLLLAKIFNYGNPAVVNAQYILWELKSYQMLDNEMYPEGNPISIDPTTLKLLPNDSGQPFDGMMFGDDLNQFYLGPLSGQVFDLVLLPDNRTAVASHCKFAKSMAGRCVQLAVYVFDSATPFLAPREIPTPDSAVSFLEIAYDQNNQLFALTDAGGGNMQLWQEEGVSLTPLYNFPAPAFISFRELKGIEFIPDLHLVAWGAPDNRIIYRDLESGVSEEYRFDFSFSDFEISPDGRFWAFQTETGTRMLTRDQKDLSPLETGLDPAITGPMGFDSQAQIFAVGTGTDIRVFDTATWSQITDIKITSTGDSVIDSLFVSRDGKTVAVGMNPVQVGPIETSYLIDVQTGIETGPFDEIMTPILNPDNNQLASMGPYSNEGITLWNLDLASWKARACQIANRNLTEAEWGQYMGNEPYQLTCPNLPGSNLNPLPTATIEPVGILPEPTSRIDPTEAPDQLIKGLDILIKPEATKITNLRNIYDLSTEQYSEQQLTDLGNIVPIKLTTSMPLSLSVGWCATTKEILDENLSSLQMTFEVNKIPIPDQYITNNAYIQDEWQCLSRYIVINQWQPGEYHLTYSGYTPVQINDGKDNFGPGQIFGLEYVVTVP